MSDAAESHADLAYVKLESLIITLKLKPSAMVTERQLIETCALGRTPVREAIQRLNWQGLISVRPRAGLQIAPLRRENHKMILEVRRQLEPLAARLVAGAVDDTARKALIACAKAMTECSVTGDAEGFLAADKEFDLILEANCPNPFISQALAPLQTHSRRFWFHSATAETLERSVNLHVSVIRAMLQENPVLAHDAMLKLLDGLTEMAASNVTSR
jgi:DNA-binding GntR family transcriptional regulator